MSRYIVRSLADLPTMGHRSNAPIHGQYVWGTRVYSQASVFRRE